ncbi:MAG: hypothetical protein K0B11_04760 [Mariniphaga sp.]|nr:hypothetical protein [Mariniphaga sp.]
MSGQTDEKDNDRIIMKFLLHKDKEEKEKPAHKSKSVAALPSNRPFAATHMFFFADPPVDNKLLINN